MRFGFYLPNSGPTSQPDALAEIARRGDQLGFDCMVAPDHIIQPTQRRIVDTDALMYEALTA